MHGGALGSGAPKGKRNGAWKHGHRTNEARERHRELRGMIALLKTTAKAVSE